MWGDGQFVNYCDPNRASNPIQQPIYGDETIVEDTTNNTAGFSKGYNGLWLNQCTGTDTSCREWWEHLTSGHNGSHTYFTITNGLNGNNNSEDNWAKWKPQSISPGTYEIYVWVPETVGYPTNTFSWQANYVVVDAFRSSKKIVDEYSGNSQYDPPYDPRNKWLSLGVYQLDSNAYVYLTDFQESYVNNHCPTGYLSNGHYWCRVAADAVKFVRIKYRNNLPLTLKDYPACAKPIQNSDFENGIASWSTGGSTTITFSQHYSGSASVWLGGINNANDTLDQTFTIPSIGPTGKPVVNANLNYYWYISTEETTHPYDFLYVKIRNASGYDIVTLETLNDGSSTNGWYYSYFNLNSYIGQTIQIYFNGTTDGSNITSFYIDDVYLNACEGF